MSKSRKKRNIKKLILLSLGSIIITIVIAVGSLFVIGQLLNKYTVNLGNCVTSKVNLEKPYDLSALKNLNAEEKASEIAKFRNKLKKEDLEIEACEQKAHKESILPDSWENNYRKGLEEIILKSF